MKSVIIPPPNEFWSKIQCMIKNIKQFQLPHDISWTDYLNELNIISLHYIMNVQEMMTLMSYSPRGQCLTKAGLPTSTEFPYSVRILHAKYGSTNLAYKIRKLTSVSSVT